MAKKNDKLSAFEEELLKGIKKVKEFKLSCEANIVSILYKNPDLYYDYESITIKNFSYNEWKVYFQIGYDIIVKENKKSLDEITVGLYLEKHSKLKEKYTEYGGFDTIEKAKEYVKEKNIIGYDNELHKWNTVLELLNKKFPVVDRIKEFVDMSLEEMYNEYEAILNHVFINAESDDACYDIADNIYELIDELNEGSAIGMPLHNAPLLSKEIGGDLVGNITLVGGLSGSGKSSMVRTTKIPSVIEFGEKLVIMINEEGLKKWQRELIVWVSNNIFKEDLQKYIVRDGKYSKETKDLLLKCAEWIKSNSGLIKVIPFKKYSTNKAIKVIKKYSSIGVKYFVLDTFKADSKSSNNDAFWINMQQSMVDIYDTIKPDQKNVHITITFQLSKSSSKQRYYTQENVGMAKNMIDVASTCIMIRQLFDDEFEGEKKELKVYRLEGKNNKTKIPVKLTKNKHYQVIFIVKNREGASNDYQIVVEHDLSRNTYKEIGITTVPVDF